MRTGSQDSGVEFALEIGAGAEVRRPTAVLAWAVDHRRLATPRSKGRGAGGHPRHSVWMAEGREPMTFREAASRSTPESPWSAAGAVRAARRSNFDRGLWAADCGGGRGGSVP